MEFLFLVHFKHFEIAPSCLFILHFVKRVQDFVHLLLMFLLLFLSWFALIRR